MSEIEQNSNPTPERDSSTIRAMREQIEQAAARAKEAEAARLELEAKLKEIERAKLDELERTRLEKEDLQKAIQDRDARLIEADKWRDELGRYASKFESIYTDELADVPDDKRDVLVRLSTDGTWAERVEKLREAKKLLGSAAPAIAGTRTATGGGAPVAQPANRPTLRNPDGTLHVPSWGEVLKPSSKEHMV